MRELKLANQRLARNSRGNFANSIVKTSAEQLPLSVPALVVDEHDLQIANNAANAIHKSPLQTQISNLITFTLTLLLTLLKFKYL